MCALAPSSWNQNFKNFGRQQVYSLVWILNHQLAGTYQPICSSPKMLVRTQLLRLNSLLSVTCWTAFAWLNAVCRHLLEIVIYFSWYLIDKDFCVLMVNSRVNMHSLIRVNLLFLPVRRLITMAPAVALCRTVKFSGTVLVILDYFRNCKICISATFT